MVKRFAALSVLALALAPLPSAAAAVAGQEPAAVKFDPHGCPQGDICLWDRPNYQGTMKELSKAGCYTDTPYIASVVNNSTQFRFSSFKGKGKPCRLDPLATAGQPVQPQREFPNYDVHDTSYLIHQLGQLPKIH